MGIIPFVGRVIAPCDQDGTPAMDESEVGSAQFETGVVMIAWLGRVIAFPFGSVSPRMIDPANPKRYAPGNL